MRKVCGFLWPVIGRSSTRRRDLTSMRLIKRLCRRAERACWCQMRKKDDSAPGFHGQHLWDIYYSCSGEADQGGWFFFFSRWT